MFTHTLSPQTSSLLQLLQPSNLPADSYLAGGTAIALQLGHRISQDLDFFTPTKFSETAWETKLREELALETTKRDWQTLAGTINSVKFSLFYYPHKLIESPTTLGKILVASLPDMAAIKLDTIISRGAKRDLVDIFFLVKKYSLPKLFAFYQEKFGTLADREVMIKKGLVYFTDADRDEDPNMLTKITWEEIKSELQLLVSRG